MAWLGRSSFFELSRLGNGANLSHNTQLILDSPRLGDLAPLYAVYGYAREFHFFASRGDAHILTLVGGPAPPASNHLVPLGYEVLYGAYHVREASPEICCLLLGSLGLIGCKEFLCCIEVTAMVPEFLLFPAHHSLVLFYRHIRLIWGTFVSVVARLCLIGALVRQQRQGVMHVYVVFEFAAGDAVLGIGVSVQNQPVFVRQDETDGRSAHEPNAVVHK